MDPDYETVREVIGLCTLDSGTYRTRFCYDHLYSRAVALAPEVQNSGFKTVAMNESSQSWLSSLLCRRISPTLSFFVRVCRAHRPSDFIVAGLGLHSFCQFDFFQVSTHILT